MVVFVVVNIDFGFASAMIIASGGFRGAGNEAPLLSWGWRARELGLALVPA